MTQSIKYFTPEELGIEDEDEFLYDPEPDGFVFVTEETIAGQARWWTQFERVAQRTSDMTYWKFSWRAGSTEMQDVGTDLDACQVEPVEVTVTQYRPVKSS